MRYVTTTIDDKYYSKLDSKASEMNLSRAALIRRILSRYFDTLEENDSQQTLEFTQLIKEALTLQEMAKDTKDDINEDQTPNLGQTKGKFVW